MSSDFDPTGDDPIAANRIRTPGIDDEPIPVDAEVLRFWTVLGYVRALTQYTRACRAFSDGRSDDLRLAALHHAADLAAA